MLSQLFIKNIAVIESASVDFENGFNVFTGETGAGKSILIDAINAVLCGAGHNLRLLVRWLRRLLVALLRAFLRALHAVANRAPGALAA